MSLSDRAKLYKSYHCPGVVAIFNALVKNKLPSHRKSWNKSSTHESKFCKLARFLYDYWDECILSFNSSWILTKYDWYCVDLIIDAVQFAYRNVRWEQTSLATCFARTYLKVLINNPHELMPDNKEAEFCREAVAFLGADTSEKSFKEFLAKRAWDPSNDGKNSSFLMWHHYKLLVDMGHIDACQIPKDAKRRVKQTPNFFRAKLKHQPVLVKLLLEPACGYKKLLPPDNWKELWHTGDLIQKKKCSTKPKLVQTVAPSLGSNFKPVMGSMSVKGRIASFSKNVFNSTKSKLPTLKKINTTKTAPKSSGATGLPSLKTKVVPLLRQKNRMTLAKYKTKRKAHTFKEHRSTKKKKVSQEELFEVERILDMRLTENGAQEYFVKWKGYDESESTWETKKDCVNCELAIKQFFESRKAGVIANLQSRT